MSDYKPGDVALVGGRDGDKVRAIWQGNRWATQNERYLNVWQVETRPLVVIDPEDREQVEQLCDLIDKAFNDVRIDGAGPDSVELAQAALRSSLIAPPRPEEPMGLGAVVEDANGRIFIRTADTDCSKPWSYANNYSDHHWNDVAAVKVLSEGVQP